MADDRQVRECPTTVFIIRDGDYCASECTGLDLDMRQCRTFDDECLEFGDHGNLKPCALCGTAWAKGKPSEETLP